jgi:uncharacterized protein YbaR (Trm112 family)
MDDEMASGKKTSETQSKQSVPKPANTTLEEAINDKKHELFELVFQDYLNSTLESKELARICQEIEELLAKKKQAEHQPDGISSKEDPVEIEAVELSGEKEILVCPKCGSELEGEFCPEHGYKGVRRTTSTDPFEKVPYTGRLICPQCKLPIIGKFCPVDGLPGIIPPAAQRKAGGIGTGENIGDQGNMSQLICPVCRRSLEGEYCPVHGKKGIVK